MDKEKTFDEIYEEDCRVVDKLFEKFKEDVLLGYPPGAPVLFEDLNLLGHYGYSVHSELTGFVMCHNVIYGFDSSLSDYLQKKWSDHRKERMRAEYTSIKEKINSQV